jgi:dTDP-4-dehydrorhamnose 3,5-epimerase
MKFVPTPLAGCFVLEPEIFRDDRGSFARTFCQAEFEKHGLRSTVVQCSVSHNVRKGTLRGMHLQAPPHAECKLVRCSRGEVFDVALDLREDSATYRQWFGIGLSVAAGNALYIPEGFAHGFLTLTDDADVVYQMSSAYEPTSARGVRWDDPAFLIRWPSTPTVISERDRSYKLLGEDSAHG